MTKKEERSSVYSAAATRRAAGSTGFADGRLGRNAFEAVDHLRKEHVDICQRKNTPKMVLVPILFSRISAYHMAKRTRRAAVNYILYIVIWATAVHPFAVLSRLARGGVESHVAQRISGPSPLQRGPVAPHQLGAKPNP